MTSNKWTSRLVTGQSIPLHTNSINSPDLCSQWQMHTKTIQQHLAACIKSGMIIGVEKFHRVVPHHPVISLPPPKKKRHPWSLTARPWKIVLGYRSFPYWGNSHPVPELRWTSGLRAGVYILQLPKTKTSSLFSWHPTASWRRHNNSKQTRLRLWSWKLDRQRRSQDSTWRNMETCPKFDGKSIAWRNRSMEKKMWEKTKHILSGSLEVGGCKNDSKQNPTIEIQRFYVTLRRVQGPISVEVPPCDIHLWSSGYPGHDTNFRHPRS